MAPSFCFVKKLTIVIATLLPLTSLVGAVPNPKTCSANSAITSALSGCIHPTSLCHSYLGYGPSTTTITTSVTEKPKTTTTVTTISKTVISDTVTSEDTTTTTTSMTTTFITPPVVTQTTTLPYCGNSIQMESKRDAMASPTEGAPPPCLKSYSPSMISSICSCYYEHPVTSHTTVIVVDTSTIDRTSRTTTTTTTATATSYTTTVITTTTNTVTMTLDASTTTSTVLTGTGLPAGLFNLQFTGGNQNLNGEYALTPLASSDMSGTADQSVGTLYYVDISDGGTSQVIFAQDTVGRLGVSTGDANNIFGTRFLATESFYSAWCTIGEYCDFSCATNPLSTSLDLLATCDDGNSISLVDSTDIPSGCDALEVTVVDAFQPYNLQDSVSFADNDWAVYSQDEGQTSSSQTMMALTENVHISLLADTSIVVYDTSTTPWSILANPNNFIQGGNCGNPSLCELIFQGDGNFVDYNTNDNDLWDIGSQVGTTITFSNAAPYVSITDTNDNLVWQLGDSVQTQSPA